MLVLKNKKQKLMADVIDARHFCYLYNRMILRVYNLCLITLVENINSKIVLSISYYKNVKYSIAVIHV